MLTCLKESVPEAMGGERGTASRQKLGRESSAPRREGRSGTLPPERRRAVRIRSIYRVATVRCDGFAAASRIHNLSDTGAMIETGVALAVGSLVELEISPRHSVLARVMWQQDGRAGLHYDGRVDCFSIIREIADDHWRVAEARPRLASRQTTRAGYDTHEAVR